MTSRRVLLGGGTAVLLAFVAWVVVFSSWLAADSVKVSGEQTLSRGDVLAAAKVDLGAPMVRLDTTAIRERVAALPAVADVEVHRSWPHTVSIKVIERKPLATIRRDGSWWVLDKEGVVFLNTGERDTTLPVVDVHAKVETDALREVASVVAALPDHLLADVNRLTARSMDSITLHLKNGDQIKWGSAAESARKVEVLNVLLSQVDAKVYDVSVPAQPTSSK